MNSCVRNINRDRGRSCCSVSTTSPDTHCQCVHVIVQEVGCVCVCVGGGSDKGVLLLQVAKQVSRVSVKHETVPGMYDNRSATRQP